MAEVNLQACCEDIIDSVEGALACAVADIATGLPLALHVRGQSGLHIEAMEFLASASVTAFQSNLDPPSDDTTDESQETVVDSVQEVQSTTEDTYHFLALVPDTESELLILITDRENSNLGLGWMGMRQAQDIIRNAKADQAALGAIQPPASQSNSQMTRLQRRRRRTVWGLR